MVGASGGCNAGQRRPIQKVAWMLETRVLVLSSQGAAALCAGSPLSERSEVTATGWGMDLLGLAGRKGGWCYWRDPDRDRSVCLHCQRRSPFGMSGVSQCDVLS